MLAHNWWAVGIRGLLGICFGLFALFWPGVTMLSLVAVFAAYAFVDGVFAIASAIWAARGHKRWGILVLEGLIGIAAAVVAVMWLGITIIASVFVVASWAILTGLLELLVASRLDIESGRRWLALGGVASLVYGGLLIVAPMVGAVVLT